MAKDPYAYAPDIGEEDAGMVKLADEHGDWHTFTVGETLEMIGTMHSAIDAANNINRGGMVWATKR